MAKRAAPISPSSGNVEVYIAQARASIAAELAPAAVSPFTIEVRFLGGLTPKQKKAFKSAADRWSRVIVGDLPSVKVDNEVIDDVVILAQGSPIDGVGGILGQAGPTHLRPQGAGVAAFLPAKGKMTFDTADLKQMEQDGTLERRDHPRDGARAGDRDGLDVQILAQGSGHDEPNVLGEGGDEGIRPPEGTDRQADPGPGREHGGPGTADSHWRETVFRSEMMTGFIGASGNPLSRMTVGSLQDLGYVVDLNAAEPYSLPNLLVLAEEGLLGAPLEGAARGLVLPNVPILLPETSLQ